MCVACGGVHVHCMWCMLVHLAVGRSSESDQTINTRKQNRKPKITTKEDGGAGEPSAPNEEKTIVEYENRQ